MSGRVRGGGRRGELDLVALRRWTWVVFWALSTLAMAAVVLEWR